MGWNVVIADVGGFTRSFIEGIGFQHTRRLNGWSDVRFSLDTLDVRTVEVSVGERTVKAWRDGVLRFHGRIWEPLQDTASLVQVEARDPFAGLMARRVRTETVDNFTDAGLIGWNLINAQNAFTSTNISQGVIDTSVSRSRTYEAGKTVGEAIVQLTEVEDGFFFTIDPDESVPGVYGLYRVKYPTSGSDRSASVRFEYGEGTQANIADYAISTLLPVNRITATGQQLTSSAEDVASQNQYGMYEQEKAFSSVTLQATLDEHAAAELRPAPIEVFSVTPNPESPLLYEDFDVGDLVGLTIRHGRINRTISARVTEATVNVDDNSDERLSGLILEEAI